MTELANSQLSETRTVRWYAVLLCSLAATFIYFLQFQFPATPIFVESDQLIFIYEGWRMSLGDVIYRDIFQFTFPGSQTYYASMILIFGTKFWILNATVVLLGALACYFTLLISRQVLPDAFAYIPPIVFVFYGMRWFGLDGSHRMFSPLFILLAVFVAIKARTHLGFAAVGALCATAAFFTQQKGFIAIAAVCIWLLIDGFRASDLRRSATHAIAAVAGFAISLLLLIVPFAISAGPAEFIKATFIYPSKFYSYDTNNQFSVIFTDVSKITGISGVSDAILASAVALYTFILPLACLAAIATMIVRRSTYDRSVMLVIIMATLLTFTNFAPNSIRLFTTSGLSLIVLIWLASLIFSSPAMRRTAAVAVIVPAALLAVAQVYRTQTNASITYIETPTGTIAAPAILQTERYVFLSKNTKPGDAFFEVYEPFIYFPLQLRNPTRFGQIWNSAYTPPEHVAEVLEDLRRDPPRYILWDNAYNLPVEARPTGDNTAPLSDFVLAEYEPVGPEYLFGDHPIQIWQRR